ncbi:MAG: Hsp20/alpha crystallin family protein [Flavobacteriales bacterium]|nr:Hsp20/alpha crystallin family protein [Flavobacteriales bacterium]
MYPTKFRNCATPANSMNAFFDDAFTRDLFRHPAKARTASSPAVNVKETTENFSLELAAPGLEKADFNIDMKDQLLSISVEKKNENKQEGENYSRREWSYSNFRRSFSIPENVDAAKIAATYTNGILIVVLPKKEISVSESKKQIVVA